MMDRKKVLNKYLVYGLIVDVVLFVSGWLADHFLNMHIGQDLMISFFFTLLVLLVYGFCWKKVAESSTRILTYFYLAGSTIRMLLAGLVVLVYWFQVSDYISVRNFSIVFLIFYLVMLAYDAMFFIRVEKNEQ
ncbi:MAG: hypothetical protein PUH24_09085 [Prevotellaceae bacterium]|nr:hypothetical protein [Prevotellaceae bacterium]MDY6130186.1 hypothetical protein [Prevotella sp.]